MDIRKKDVKALLERAEFVLRTMDPMDPGRDLLEYYIFSLKNELPYIKGKLSSSQKELYKRLEIAIG